ncbi:MAG: response regulator [Opitutaceae bacterium]
MFLEPIKVHADKGIKAGAFASGRIMARILIIDDEDDMRMTLRAVLGRNGHTIAEARNGREALRLFQRTEFDLLITDILMPEMEGLELLMEVRKLRRPAKAIAISGGGRVSAHDCLSLARHMGAATVLAKPFTSEMLLGAVDGLLEDCGAGDERSAPA